MTNYRYNIGLQDKYTFGTELEFSDVNLTILYNEFQRNQLPIKYSINHKINDPKYDAWYLDKDSTVTKKINGTLIGGELSSRILTDTKTVWKELEDICDVLKSTNATITSVCSNHVRICLSPIKKKSLFFEIFSKIIAILEVDLILFFMGDDYLIRDTQRDYAHSLRPYLLNYINHVDFQDETGYLFDLRNSRRGILLFTNRDAINLNDFYTRNLMEIRYPNGSLNAKTIQNNINFILKLIDAIDRGLFNPQELYNIVEK